MSSINKLIGIDELAYFLSKLDSRNSGLTHVDVTVPATGWTQDTTNNCYTRTVTVSGMTAASRPTVCFCPPHDFTLVDSQEDAYNTLYAGESVAGGIRLYATEVPATSFKITVAF